MSCKSPDKQDLVRIRPRPRYWKSVEELNGARGSSTEFPGGLPAPGDSGGSDATRRDFLSLMGFSVTAATMAACRAPTQHALPLPVGTDQLIPGVPAFYATTCGGCASSCGLLVRQRDGRPIKIEGNDESPLFGGGTCATGQATVLSLYDDERLRGPSVKGEAVSWPEVDRKVLESLEQSKASGRKIVLLTGTVNSPSTRQIIAEWSRRFPTFRHVVHDGVSLSAMRAANEQSFGEEVVPHYAFDKARVIVALEADFLGTWLSPVEFAHQYAQARKPTASPLLHVQIESGLSITGSNADVRVPVPPSELGAVAVALLARIAAKAHVAGVRDVPTSAEPRKLDEVADALWRAKGQSLVVCGSQDVNVQIVVNALNSLLGNVGQTVDIAMPSQQRQGDDAAVAELIADMSAGSVGTLILHGVNPLYDHPDAARFREGLGKVGLAVSLSGRRDETAAEVGAVCPDHHFLESWGDAEPVASYFSLLQPLIAPLFETRAAQESLLRWAGIAETDYHAHLRNFWKATIFPQQQELDDFEAFWDRSLGRGFVIMPPA
jgi:molybdopterin-containing oxidoreductase family iron-sulfur binding subunit